MALAGWAGFMIHEVGFSDLAASECPAEGQLWQVCAMRTPYVSSAPPRIRATSPGISSSCKHATATYHVSSTTKEPVVKGKLQQTPGSREETQTQRNATCLCAISDVLQGLKGVGAIRVDYAHVCEDCCALGELFRAWRGPASITHQQHTQTCC